MKPTSSLMKIAFFLAISLIGSAVTAASQSLVASPNDISLKRDDNPTVITITQGNKPVKDATCKIPIVSFEK